MFKIILNKKETYHEGLISKDTYNYYLAGDIFEPEGYSIDSLYDELRSGTLDNLIGEFSCVIEDDESIFIINDELATIKWYYYQDSSQIIISNDFWEIVNIIKPTVENINKNAIYEQLLVVNALDGKTFIDGINCIEPGMLIKINKKTLYLRKTQYVDIIYSPRERMPKNDLFNEIDHLFSKMVNKINKLNNNPQIGITISGGLDSRFPLPYLNSSNVVSAYLIGKNNNVLFSSYDYDSAKKISDLYKVKFKMIDPFSTDLSEQVVMDISRNPTIGNNILKSVNYNKIFSDEKFNVLITGAYGGLIGGRVLNDELLGCESERLDDFTYSLFGNYSSFKHFKFYQNTATNNFLLRSYSRLKKLLSIFKIGIYENQQSKRIEIEQFLNDDFLFKRAYKRNVFNKIHKYIKTEKLKNKNTLSIIMKYHLSIHSISGGFESLHGQVKSYSIYNPYIYQFSKQWPMEYLKGRSIMEEFLYKKHKELSKIPLQGYQLPICYSFDKYSITTKVVKQIMAILQYKIKGLSINYNTWYKNKDLKRHIVATFNNTNSFFFTIFDRNDINKIISKKEYSHFAFDLYKAKLLIDIIEEESYSSLLSDDNFRMSKKY